MEMRAIALTLLVLGATACEHEEAANPEAERPEDVLLHDSLADAATPAADSVEALTITMTEWNVRLAQDTLASGGLTTFRARNNGEYAHILAVEGQGNEWVTDTIPPGDWAVLETDLQPGTYEVFCPIDAEHGDHSALGMVAPLVVLDAPTR